MAILNLIMTLLPITILQCIMLNIFLIYRLFIFLEFIKRNLLTPSYISGLLKFDIELDNSFSSLNLKTQVRAPRVESEYQSLNTRISIGLVQSRLDQTCNDPTQPNPRLLELKTQKQRIPTTLMYMNLLPTDRGRTPTWISCTELASSMNGSDGNNWSNKK